MKIAGRRADGALYLSIGGGLAVILRGDRVSAPHDESEIERMGPWTWAPDDNTFEARQAIQRKVDRASVVMLNNFQLAAPPPWLDKKIEGEGEGEGEGEKKDAGPQPKKDGLFVKKEEAVALDDSIPAEKDKDKKPVSEIAQTAQAGEAAAPAPQEAVMNLPPPPDPVEERKKKREELRGKINGTLKSQKKVSDMLGDEEVSDDDLYAMAKALHIHVPPGTLTLTDNAVKFQRLLASTTVARTKHLADAGEHPFTYCKENIIPSMEKEGKAPDDPDAFCAWWKSENA